MRTRAAIWQRSLVFKYAFFTTLMAVLALLVLAVSVYSSYRSLLEKQEQDFASTILNQFSNSLIEPLLTDDIFRIELSTRTLLENSEVQAVQVFDRRSASLVINRVAMHEPASPKVNEWLDSEFRTGRALAQASDATTLEALDTAAQGRFVTTTMRFDGVEVGKVGILIRSDGIKAAFSRMLLALVLITVLLLLICFLIATIVAQRIAKPLRTLVGVTREIGDGNFNPHKLSQLSERHDELGYLGKAFKQMTKNLQTKIELESVFHKVIDKQVASEFMAKIADRRQRDLTVSDSISLDAKMVDVSVLFVDVVNFTGFSEQASPDQVVDLLNEYFSLFTNCAEHFEGSVDKFIGDCAMIVFGAPRGNGRHAHSAILCAAAINKVVAQFNQERLIAGLPVVNLRTGVNSGKVFAGVIGATSRMEYTVIGDAVNTAARLCDLAKPSEILVGSDTLKLDDMSIGMSTDRNLRTLSELFQFSAPVRTQVKGKDTLVDALVLEKILSRTVQNEIEKCLKAFLHTGRAVRSDMVGPQKDALH